MFLKQLNKKILFVLLVILFSSCSEYQQLLRKGDLATKYKAAEEYYKEGNYKKSLRLLQLIVPAYRGKPQAERLLFYEADTYYNLKDYYISAYKFDKFITAFPKSDKVEEAQFKAARSTFELSSRSSLDQTETLEALDKLQRFINENPESQFLEEANKYAIALQNRLERKYYDIAKLYHHREIYKAAIKAFDNYLLTYPGSSYTEQALYYKQESAYELAINSFENLVKERLTMAKEYNESYLKYAKDDDLKNKAQKIAEDIKYRLETVN